MSSLTPNSLTPRQRRRVEVLTRLCAGSIDVTTAACLLGLSDRQTRRLQRRFEEGGAASVTAHGNRGRAPANRTDPAFVEAVTALAGPRGIYHDFNVCHLRDKLAEEGVNLGRSTLDRLLKERGLRVGHRERREPLRRRRQRRSAEGMLLQIDGSFHDWLEGRGPWLCLLAAIDDATGKIVAALFRPSEDLPGYLGLLRQIVTAYGLPMALYHDRHTILRSPKEATVEDELAGKVPMSQFQRVLDELDIESVTAYSAPAKGRVERLFGTLQDRFVKEMRLKGVATIEEANAFLPRFILGFNACFGKPAADPCPAWEPAAVDGGYFFAVRHWRVVQKDHTVRCGGEVLQILPKRGETSLAGERVSVHLTPEGERFLYHGKRRLRYEPVPTGPSGAASTRALTPSGGSPPSQAPRKATAGQRGWLFGKP